MNALRTAADRVRAAIANGQGPADSDAAATIIESGAQAALAAGARGSLRPVINATGVVIHTNLGRAPIAPVALERLAAIAAGYSNLDATWLKAHAAREPCTPNLCSPR